jgi:hypothetical protein
LFARNLSFFLASCLLVGCGFEPLYHSSSGRISTCEQLAQVKIARIKDREGQVLRNRLVDIINIHGEPACPCALLEIDLGESEAYRSLRKDGTASRYQITITATMRLKDCETGELLYQDTARAITSYYVGDISSVSAYSTTIAKRDATNKTLKVLAEEIELMIASYYKHSLEE